MKNRYVLLASLVLCSVLLVGCGTGKEDALQKSEALVKNEQQDEQEKTQQDEQEEQGIQTGEASQEPYVLTFEANTVAGEAMTSDIFNESKLTMINVWATYCNPCLAEMPALGEIAGNYDKSEFQMIGIVSDVTEDAADDVETAKSLIEETQANYPHLLLNESLYVNLVGAVEAVPTTFFINREGELMGYLVGSYEKAAWEEIIVQLLAECE